MTADADASPAALAGIRILDFSRVLAGPFATMILGDLGAEVLKVERPGEGDVTRSWGPPHAPGGEATYFLSVNRNKRSIALDLGSEEGRRRARELAAEADVVVENFRPGVMDGFGLGAAELRAADPRLVYCSITAFGSGAGAGLPGFDLLVQALGGLMSITGDPGGEPQKVGVALVDVIAGLFASVGILAALRHRERSGAGQLLEINLLSSLLAALVNQGAAQTVAGVTPERMGNAHPSIAPYESFATGEGELVLAVGTDRQFGALCEVLGRPALAQDPRFARNPDRVANRAALKAELESALAARPAAAWAAELTAARVPAGVVNDLSAAFALAERIGLKPLIEVPGAGGAGLSLTANPIGLSLTPHTYREPPPRLPRHDGRRRGFDGGS